MMTRRQIIRIDEKSCTGCGECVPSCAEGALAIVDGKARVVADRLCDGLGACLGRCPEGALTIEERDAPEFDEVAVEQRLDEIGRPPLARELHPATLESHPATMSSAGGCPGSAARELRPSAAAPEAAAGRDDSSLLQHWPVQLGLVNPMAPFLRGADLLVAADCVPVAYRFFHEDFLAGRSVVIACPKLDDARAHMEKLAELFRAARPRSVTVAHMEVPCCFGLTSLVEQAAALADLEAPVTDIVITLDGGKTERLLRPAATAV
jgi:NAD-dependent dihydropyrimidine dehydrogenase PreA subunit